jgi:hypothetical protein
MSVDLAVFGFGAFVSFLVAAGFLRALYSPAYREEARRDGRKGVER